MIVIRVSFSVHISMKTLKMVLCQYQFYFELINHLSDLCLYGVTLLMRFPLVFCVPRTHPKTQTHYKSRLTGPYRQCLLTCHVAAARPCVSGLADRGHAVPYPSAKWSINLAHMAPSCACLYFFFALIFSAPPISGSRSLTANDSSRSAVEIASREHSFYNQGQYGRSLT